jgi:hypothetical protein
LHNSSQELVNFISLANVLQMLYLDLALLNHSEVMPRGLQLFKRGQGFNRFKPLTLVKVSSPDQIGCNSVE